MAWNVDGEFLSPKNITNGLNSLYLVLNAALCSSPFLMHTLLYPCLTSNLENISASLTCAISSGIRGRVLRFAKHGPTWTKVVWMQP
jgi:hypothetical protein